MKRRELLRHLEKHGCEFLREGGNHTIYVNRRAQKSSSIPRHREIIAARLELIKADKELTRRSDEPAR